MLTAIAEGETDPAAVAARADYRLRATPEELCDALGACGELHPVYRRLLKTALEDWQRTEAQITQLGQQMATLLAAHQEQVQRLAEGSSRQGCESCGVKVLAPSIACIRTGSISGACGGNEARDART